MTNDNKTPAPDLTTLAAEACDLWQEHLTACASDPKLKDEMMRLMEPSRQMFAGWAQMMQHTPHGPSAPTSATTGMADSNAADATPAQRPAPAGPASDDGALRLAQLAYRVAELEKRLARLESEPRRAAPKAARAAGRSKS